MTIDVTVEQVSEILKEKDDILILCHKNPDGDTLGSAAALCHALISVGKKCVVLCNDAIPEKFDFLKIPSFKNEFTPKYIVAVDVASANLLGNGIPQYWENVDLCIDHHASNTRYAKQLCLKGNYPAAAQIIYEIICAMDINISKHIADCLYTGIITDTGCFMYSSTMPQTHIVAAKLMECGADFIKLNEKFFMQKSAKTVMLEKFALNNYEFYFDDKAVLLFLTIDTLKEINPSVTDLDGLASVARNFEGVEVSVLFRQTGEDKFKGSIRTGESTDASMIASAFGGGGHVRAAGCELHGSIDDIRQNVLKEIGKQICQQTATE